MGQHVANQSQSPRWQLHGHSNGETIFDVGSQVFPLTCAVGWPRLAASCWEQPPMTARAANTTQLQYYTASIFFFNHHPSVRILPFSRRTGLQRFSNREARRSLNSGYAFECMQVRVCVRRGFRSLPSSAQRELPRHRLSPRTLIGSAGGDEFEVDEVEMNET